MEEKIQQTSPFFIDISDIISTHLGDHESYEFEDEIDSHIFEEIVINWVLKIRFDLVRRSYGVELRIHQLEGNLDIPEDYISGQAVYLQHISREYHLEESIEDTDDVEYIDKVSLSVDIWNAIEQEILISCLI